MEPSWPRACPACIMPPRGAPQAWWGCIPVMPALERWRWEDWKFKAILGDIVSSKPALDTGDPALKEQQTTSHVCAACPHTSQHPPDSSPAALASCSPRQVLSSLHTSLSLEGKSDLSHPGSHRCLSFRDWGDDSADKARVSQTGGPEF